MTNSFIFYFRSDVVIKNAPSVHRSPSVESCVGKIHLFPKTYLRGENVTLERSNDDLNAVNFEKRVTSIKVFFLRLVKQVFCYLISLFNNAGSTEPNLT
jgi:hypothetical protein